MKSLLLCTAILVSSVLTSHAQTITNEQLRERIWNTGAGNSIVLTYDPEAKTSKLMGVSENFARSEASRSGLLAMNFAVGFFYPGDSLPKPPDTFHFAFWVMSKKPRFSENHSMTVALREEMLVIGTARYSSRAREQLEYLNFEVSRENLSKIAAGSDVRFFLGDQEFTFTKSQIKLIADVLSVTAPNN